MAWLDAAKIFCHVGEEKQDVHDEQSPWNLCE